MKLRYDGPGHRFDARGLKPGDYVARGEVAEFTDEEAEALLERGFPHMSEPSEGAQDEPEADDGEGHEEHEED